VRNYGSEALTANMPVFVLLVAADSRSDYLCQCHVSIITNRHVLQGSIQATLAAGPLELAYVYKSGAHHYTAWAEAITVVGVFSILIGATIAWLSAAFLGPALLTKVCVVSRSVLWVLSCAACNCMASTKIAVRKLSSYAIIPVRSHHHIAGLLCQGTQPSWHVVLAIEQRLTMSARVVNIQEEEELPVVAQPGSPEPNENNPFLSGLQQSGISITGMTALLGLPGCHLGYASGF